MATKQKYEIRYNEKRKKFELYKAGLLIFSAETEASAKHHLSCFRNFPFAPVMEE